MPQSDPARFHLRVGDIRKAIATLKDDDPIWVCHSGDLYIPVKAYTQMLPNRPDSHPGTALVIEYHMGED
jgi:hypothetical protein